jgi:hypothetical protein
VNRLRATIWLIGLLAGLVLVGAQLEASRDVPRMTRAAQQFLASLDGQELAAATFAMDDEERTRFHFIPVEMFERRGLMLKDMSAEQRARAEDLLGAGLSQRGYMTTQQIMELEDALLAMEGGQRFARNGDEYLVSIFGSPEEGASWGWRFEGHHISLHFTVIAGSIAVASPAFLGTNPAEVREGPQRGRRPLGEREDYARRLVQSLNEAQRQETIINVEAPRDLVTGNSADVDPIEPFGLSVGEMTGEQRSMLMDLIDVYLSVMSDEIAAHRRQRLFESDVQGLTFAWAGGIHAGEGHYYRVQGPTFLIEYDNVQNGANHVHSVWRDFDGDFGRDLLREHRGRVEHALEGR